MAGKDTPKKVFFYENDFYVLSNFSAFRLEWGGTLFDTSEAAYHWEKFHDHPEIQFVILHAKSAHDAFKYAEKYRKSVSKGWKGIRLEVMKKILWAKLRQHEYVHRKLLDTGDRLLVEDSWRDDFWGWGEDKKGENQLGRLWMEIREELQEAIRLEEERLAAIEAEKKAAKEALEEEKAEAAAKKAAK